MVSVFRRGGCAALPSLPALLLAGCTTMGPSFEQPKPWWNPTSWFGSPERPARVQTVRSEPVSAPVDPNWWRIFHDPELTSLEDRVAASNLDVRVASFRLAESRAQLGTAEAAALPTLNADGSYTRERVSQEGVLALFGGGAAGGGPNGASGFASGGNATFGSLGASANGLAGTLGAIPSAVTGATKVPPFNLWQYGFDASWELDLWGRVRREIEAAKASVRASEETRRNVLVTALAEVGRDYVLLRGVQEELRIVRDNLRSAEESLKLSQDRYASGFTSELDVENARTQVTATASAIPGLEQQEAQVINALSLLLGQPPRALRAELAAARPIPPVPPRVPMGLPSHLLRRRPDIRAAEDQLHAATAEIGVAVASFFPAVSLSGSFGIQALMFGQLGDWAARQYGVGPTISLPIFDGGRLTATLDLRKQQQKEAALTYQRTVLQALHDVDNALVAYEAEQRRMDQLGREVQAARAALALARDRYTKGLSSFLEVLDAERAVLNSERQLADSTATVSTNLVALYKALGGGWEETYPLPPPAAGAGGNQRL